MRKRPTDKKLNSSEPRQAQDPRTIKLASSSYQPSAAELGEDLRVDATFAELTAAVVRPAKIRYVKPERKR